MDIWQWGSNVAGIGGRRKQEKDYAEITENTEDAEKRKPRREYPGTASGEKMTMDGGAFVRKSDGPSKLRASKPAHSIKERPKTQVENRYLGHPARKKSMDRIVAGESLRPEGLSHRAEIEG